MNPFAAVTWLWQALRGHSLTSAVLFACALFGISVLGWFRHLLHLIGVPWYLWLFAPFVIVTILAKKEVEWVPDASARRRWARWILLGSVIATLIFAKLAPKKPEPEPVDRPLTAEQLRRPGMR